MRLQRRVRAASLATILLACWALSSPPATLATKCMAAQESEVREVSGKMISASSDSLSLEVPREGRSETMHFTIEKHTKIENKLEVGSMVQVEYRTEDGRNFAIRIRAESKTFR